MQADGALFAVLQVLPCLVLVVGRFDPLHVVRMVGATGHEGFFVIDLPAFARAFGLASGWAWVGSFETVKLGAITGQGMSNAASQGDSDQHAKGFAVHSLHWPGWPLAQAVKLCAIHSVPGPL